MQSVNQRQSLAEYAKRVLDIEHVQVVLNSIKLSNEIGDELIDAVKLEMGKEEFVYGLFYKDALREAKRSAVRKIIEDSVPWKWMPTKQSIDLIARGVEKPGEPTLDELPVVTFYTFLFDPDFMPFLLEDGFGWPNINFPRHNTLLFVFAFFLWLKMDGRYEPTKGVTYYVEAPFDGKRDVSTIQSRQNFLRFFGEYIHTDLWTSADYVRLGKEGTVMRLRMSDAYSGRVVIQGCGDISAECNSLYLVNDLSIEELVRRYLNTGSLTLAAKPATIFQCYKCGDVGACLFHPSNKHRFYCKEECYMKS